MNVRFESHSLGFQSVPWEQSARLLAGLTSLADLGSRGKNDPLFRENAAFPMTGSVCGDPRVSSGCERKRLKTEVARKKKTLSNS